MFRYFLYLSFKGTQYCGWQKQINASTVQQSLEEALSQILRTSTEVTGAGRTDTGVHAKYYVAHFDSENPILSENDFIRRLNAVLPPDIAVFKLRQVRNDAHARFSAIARTYQYYIETQKNPFTTEFSWQIHYKLDFELMSKAAGFLTQVEDFTAFAKLHSNNTTNICKIIRADWDIRGYEWIFTITANRFLRNMVRAIVGNMIDVGRKKISLDEFEAKVLTCDRSLASVSAPAKGLFFIHVDYPENIFHLDVEN
ncbi:MAG: tRNA pseudouridine(38-40) synthase TruA [Bacteroidales bacterium]|nr:tRNA pseudouridine(38-40) synthase TruA [Bacteroidales bacterium]